MKMWGGRFTKETAEAVEKFNASVSFDQRLALEDIMGSLAHVKMLVQCGILPREEGDRIIQGLLEIREEIKEGKFPFAIELEDVHMNIEKALTEKIGPVGGKLHTARSRNDQVALDTHLYIKREMKEIALALINLLSTILDVSEKNLGVIIPGYTHLQRAQPILFSHHLHAYAAMIERDLGRLEDCFFRTDLMPLGAGALAGTTFPIDRELVRKELGFREIYYNSMDAVSDRDYLLEFLSFASILMMHLSRFCEEIILWSTEEFDFIELDDGFCTGSSIMPQKKNADVAELVRGKTGRVYGHLLGLLTVMKGMPLAYNKDMQEDKEGVFDTVDTVKECLLVFTGMVATMKVKQEEIRKKIDVGFLNATDLADYLVKKGLPFRQCHEIVGKIVLYCIREGKNLSSLTMEEYHNFSPLFDEDVFAAIDIENCVSGRNSAGGTGHEQVKLFLKHYREKAQTHREFWS
jgi:argininosuccinate lyase